MRPRGAQLVVALGDDKFTMSLPNAGVSLPQGTLALEVIALALSLCSVSFEERSSVYVVAISSIRAHFVFEVAVDSGKATGLLSSKSR